MEHLEQLDDRWVVATDGEDIDEAYDAAVAVVADTWGASHPLLDITPDDMVVDDNSRTVMGAQRLARLRDLDDQIVAAPVSADRFWARRRVNVRVDDADVNLGVEGIITEPVELGLDDTAALTLWDEPDLKDGELLDAVVVQRLRCRYKAVATKGEGKQVRIFVARAETGEVLGEGRTAGEARRVAAQAAKEALGDLHRYSIEVYAEQRRETGAHYTIERARVAQRGTVRLHLASEKNPERTKVSGWVFTIPTSLAHTAADEPDGDVAHVEATVAVEAQPVEDTSPE